jgi:hypothetical protein
MKSEIYSHIKDVSGRVEYLTELRDRVLKCEFITGDIEIELLDRNYADLLDLVKEGSKEVWLRAVDAQLEKEKARLNQLVTQL